MLYRGTDADWQYLEDTIQPGWESENFGDNQDDDDDDNVRRLTVEEENDRQQFTNISTGYWRDALVPQQSHGMEFHPKNDKRKPPSPAALQYLDILIQRHLREEQDKHKMEQRMLESDNATSTSATTTTNGNSTVEQVTAHFDDDFEPDQYRPTTTPLFPGLTDCDVSWYIDGRMTSISHLWPVWKVLPEGKSALDQQVFQDLCHAEANTQQVLTDHALCNGCSQSTTQDTCLPPYSLILFVRLTIQGGMQMDCETLSQTFVAGGYQQETQSTLEDCVAALENSNYLESGILPRACPFGFYPSILDEFFLENDGRITYTSSVYKTLGTYENIQALYNHVNDYDKGTDNIEGAYDTQWEDFANLLADTAVSSDMLLAVGSAFVTILALLVHTRSLFLSFVGIVQIVLSFPLAYFTYRFAAGLVFFPFLNFIGVFVAFSMGADQIFVAVDKMKNARKDFPNLTTEEIAAKALPDAAEAMFLTTSTTAVAFFGTAICPVAPVRLFAIFCGMLIVWDYLMDIALVFPSLCIYDQYLQRVDKPNCCMTCHCCHRWEGGKQEIDDDSQLENMQNDNDNQQQDKDKEQPSNDDSNHNNHNNMMQNIAHNLQEQAQEINQTILHDRYKDVDEDHKPSLIRRALLGYYHVLHTLRWPLLLACLAAFATCLYYATKLSLPLSSDVRLFRPDHEFEKAYAWRRHLLSEALSQGSYTIVMWGVEPADTGDHNDPNSWSQLVLDDTFDPSTREAQLYLLDFCDKFFAQEFAGLVDTHYECPINEFRDWIKREHELDITPPPPQGNETTLATTINSTTTTSSTIKYWRPASQAYKLNCGGGWDLPMAAPWFHKCITAWAKEAGDYRVLSRDGIVTVMYFEYSSRERYDSHNDLLDAEWHLTEDWMTNELSTAPPEVSKAYFSSRDYWWYDTNLQMFQTAYGSAAIAISASALVILISSRSLIMTVFSVVSVAYVLASVTSVMVAIGWYLGFLESICFAILIGISVDFVIHFSHAYTSLPGDVPREKRTKHALVYMGPSILAAAVTTIAGAVVMFFCVITFFSKFATVLFFTILQSLVGSFVVFLVMTDTIGPSRPTYLADKLGEQCRSDTPDEPTKEASTTKESQPTAAAEEAVLPPEAANPPPKPATYITNSEIWSTVLEDEVYV